MNEKEIIVAMTGTITIPTEEYKEMVTARALLESIFAHKRKDGSYRLDDMVTVAESAFRTVITTQKPVSVAEQEDEPDA